MIFIIKACIKSTDDMNKKFIPFNDLATFQQVIVVDSYHPDAFVLSHWRGSPKIKGIHDDTSTAIVLNALEKDLKELDQYPYVTNNHFDIDGFLGVWSLCFPQQAMEHSSLLRNMALMGDFREMSLQTDEDQLALKLVCWINTVEKNRFYAPFASYEPGKNETKLCVSKYEFFLQQFGKVLQKPEEFRHDWEDEYNQVVPDMQLIQGHDTYLSLQKDIRLLIVQTPEPLHYYALFSRSQPADMVLSMYDHNRYELEYKYTTWIDCGNRLSYPRLDLQPLANILNRYEESPYLWRCDRITDTGPILRLSGEKLNKEQRFDHPRNRPIYSSTIPPRKLMAVIYEYFEKAFQHAEKKAAWTWQEIREFNRELQQ